jgi:hypothetical protein
MARCPAIDAGWHRRASMPASGRRSRLRAVGAAFSRWDHQPGASQQPLDAGVAVGDGVLRAEHLDGNS